MHVLSHKKLKEYCQSHAAAKQYLLSWYKTTEAAQWNSVNDMHADFPSAELIVDGKVVFNIKANDFRLVALVGFRSKKVFLLWFGSHAEYDKIKIEDL
ncbi:type II toxin-antitoxin system HigB family toxin [Pontibacter sp. SGAir0037]|uniref:type II toxin-antitoxin system HigB family toxin n=1 Tax=Pontibacter sp. SGAir0037 TaxID=2571030 RepID=UPI0010CCF8AD|nr:type II toxin-antitoxin system HigB family toxin [Pontibacter sp. SGAir0037]QCR24675.1 type II toxin-antitoxin system HigB family toxin [Pontibacter sp. SGAir0037]